MVNSEKQPSILIIDDDTTFCRLLGRRLSSFGYQIHSEHSGEAALKHCEQSMVDFVLLDLRLGDESGLGLIKPILAACPLAKIIVLTGYASLATAVEAIKQGAVNYLPKPADASAIHQEVQNLLANDQPDNPSAPESPTPLKRLEWEQIQRVLLAHDGNVSATARQLGMHRRTLQRKLKKHPPRER